MVRVGSCKRLQSHVLGIDADFAVGGVERGGSIAANVAAAAAALPPRTLLVLPCFMLTDAAVLRDGESWSDRRWAVPAAVAAAHELDPLASAQADGQGRALGVAQSGLGAGIRRHGRLSGRAHRRQHLSMGQLPGASAYGGAMRRTHIEQPQAALGAEAEPYAMTQWVRSERQMMLSPCSQRRC